MCKGVENDNYNFILKPLIFYDGVKIRKCGHKPPREKIDFFSFNRLIIYFHFIRILRLKCSVGVEGLFT